MKQQTQTIVHNCPTMDPKFIHNQLKINLKIHVEKMDVPKTLKIDPWWSKAGKGSKSIARVVDLGEGRDPGEGVGRGNPSPGREREIKNRGSL